MTDWIKANKMYLFVGVLIIAALAIYYFMPEKQENAINADSQWQEEAAEPLKEQQKEKEAAVNQAKPETIMVDVKGAVVNPGVYEAEIGDRVFDIIELAGGLQENADKNQINFAMKVADEMVLYLPVLGEQSIENNSEAPVTGSFATASSDEGKVNLNTASETELQTITGIGPSKAAAILEYRETNGRFQEIEQLMEISGIGEKTFEKLKEEVTVK